MKANELRIGNIVLLKGESFDDEYLHIVKKITETLLLIECNEESENYSLIDNQIEALPITEDILLMFGFKYKLIDGFSRWFVKENILILHEKNSFMIEKTIANTDMSNYIKSIKYVHELQNLYFLLTDEELIK